MRTLRTAALAAVGLFGLAVASLAHARALALQPADDDAHVDVPSARVARFLSLGENELAADLTWVRTLVYYGDGMVHNNGSPDVEKLLALVNALDPHFYHPYVWGAHATTYRSGVGTQDEFRGSIAILRRGVAVFPDDWELAWLLGIRLSFDLKPDDPDQLTAAREEGAAWIEHAMHLPDAPADLPILALTLRTRLGQRDRALKDLKEMILNTDDDKARAQLQQRYAEMVSASAADGLEEAHKQFTDEWQAQMPYVPPTFYLLVGAPPPVEDLSQLEGTEGGP